MLLHQSSGERVRIARNMAGLTRKDMEDQFQVSVNTLQAWESNKIILTNKGAKRLIQIFIKIGLLCSEGWLMTGEGDGPMFLQNSSQLSCELNEDFRILRELETFKALNPDSIVTIISDNGMEPIYSVGDFVGGNKKNKDQLFNVIGENCIIETFQGDTLVRRVLLGSKKSLYNLVCLNINTDQQPILNDIQIKTAAKIILHRKKEK